MRKTAIDLTPSEFWVQKNRNPHSKELRCSTLFKFSCIEPKQRLSRTRLCKWLLLGERKCLHHAVNIRRIHVMLRSAIFPNCFLNFLYRTHSHSFPFVVWVYERRRFPGLKSRICPSITRAYLLILISRRCWLCRAA